MTFDRDLWQRARSRFDELVELDADSRRLRLDAISRDDPALAAAVERLLVADSSAETALDAYDFAPPPHPAASGDPRDPLGLVGHAVSHFLVTGYVAAGGMGVVYRAEDVRLGRLVALKFPLPQQELTGAAKERFVQEARSAASLDHPNLCSVHEIGESEHGVFLAMPLYPGETLRQRIDRDGALPLEEALAVTRRITAGLASAHAAGIVHRDLKPGNVMLLPDGGLKVLDFGLAKIRDISLTKSRAAFGTVGYVAPEQIRGERTDERADLWAIGVMLYEMLTGSQPFRGEHEMAVLHAVLHDDPRGFRDSAAPRLGGSTDVEALIGALLQKDPAHRYQSAGALLADLDALARGVPIAHRVPFWARTAGRRRARRVLGPGVVAIVLAVVGVLAWNAWRPRPGPRFSGGSAVIANSADLMAALVPANAGRRIRLRAGTYDVDRTLTVPDGMIIEGAGIMRFDGDGRPDGFDEATRTTIRMSAAAAGDMLTLGHGVTLRRLEIADLAGRTGNVVAVLSRLPHDSVSVTMEETVILNPNVFSIGASGPLGRALFIMTRNPNLGADPLPDSASAIAVRIVRSLVRAPAGGGGFFAYNFAANSTITLDIARSVIGGSNEANGGVSRPDAVHDSRVRLLSEGNLYRNEWGDACAAPLRGWNLTGGSSTPVPIEGSAVAQRNELLVRSVDDRLTGFTSAILATASRRFFPDPIGAAPADNRLVLQLAGTTIETPDCESVGRTTEAGVATDQLEPVRDLTLVGAWVANDGLAAGSGNILRAELTGVVASGLRANRYMDAGGQSGPLAALLAGRGNRLEVAGDSAQFARDNTGIDPAPAARFFR
jgi:hypothetical protein